MNLEQYTYAQILANALERVPNTVDKREGSIVYDALAPACYVLAQCYIDLNNILQTQFVETSYGEYLDRLTSQFGVEREQETKAIKKGEFEDENGNAFNVTVGDRFSTMTSETPLVYVVHSKIADGQFKLECETAGSIGNDYTGPLIPISYINGLATATLTDNITLGQDTESDDDLKARYVSAMNQKPFAGNFEAYKELALGISGIGNVQIYPLWDGGGTVLLSLVNDNNEPISSSIQNEIQNMIDPQDHSASGIGLAPIGHSVTVTTATEHTINITAVVFAEGNIANYQTAIENAIGDYIETVRNSWGVFSNYTYDKKIYISRLISAIMSVEGVYDVGTITINGDDNDYELIENSSTQEIPVLGTVTIYDENNPQVVVDGV